MKAMNLDFLSRPPRYKFGITYFSSYASQKVLASEASGDWVSFSIGLPLQYIHNLWAMFPHRAFTLDSNRSPIRQKLMGILVVESLEPG